MGTARAKKPTGFGVGGGRPSNGRDEYTGWPRGVLLVASEAEFVRHHLGRPVLARFLFTPIA